MCVPEFACPVAVWLLVLLALVCRIVCSHARYSPSPTHHVAKGGVDEAPYDRAKTQSLKTQRKHKGVQHACIKPGTKPFLGAFQHLCAWWAVSGLLPQSCTIIVCKEQRDAQTPFDMTATRCLAACSITHATGSWKAMTIQKTHQVLCDVAQNESKGDEGQEILRWQTTTLGNCPHAAWCAPPENKACARNHDDK